jgi:tRNA nucleotidyltransferase (CCA-adding enzyme)
MKGLEDLRNKLIRTPRAALIQFLEDPLRIFRIFRFAAKFGHELDAEIPKALKSPEILVILTQESD